MFKENDKLKVQRLGLSDSRNAVESTVQREGEEQVVSEEFTGEVDCGGRRTAGREKI